MKDMIITEPVIPISFDLEQKGMQSGDALSPADQIKAEAIWLKARDNAVESAQALADLGVHKSICNRLTEPFMWITVLCTATEWNNFFRLRCHPAAEKHFQKIAGMIRAAVGASVPRKLKRDEWHCPYLTEDEQKQLEYSFRIRDYAAEIYIRKVSVGRCARLSYLTHEGVRDPKADVALCERLIRPPGDPDEEVMHASPFEHVAWAHDDATYRSGPFLGWGQFRKDFPNENLEN